MASPLRPGGGVLSGATSQEESLCRRTTLYPSLRDEFYRLPEVGGVYTPDVLVFNSGLHRPRSKRKSTEADQEQDGVSEMDLEAESEDETEIEGETGDVKIDDKKDWFHVDVITAAMLRFPDLVEQDKATDHLTEKVYANQSDREMAVRQMRAVMRIGNPVEEIARAWRKVIFGISRKAKGKKVAGEVERYLNIEIVFAIKDRRTADAFAAAFGAGLRRVDDDGGNDSVGCKDTEVASRPRDVSSDESQC
ncbi:tigr02452 family [Naviculisporaceae sp. PSN 640]